MTIGEARRHGRLGDSQLVHLNPIEVSALEQLAPLTTNPKTGEKEAFLPLLASLFAPTLFSSLGLSVSPLLASAIGAGLGTWAETGDLKKGLLGGIAGYGLGSVLGKVGGALGGGGSASAGASAGGGLSNTLSNSLSTPVSAGQAATGSAAHAATKGLMGNLAGAPANLGAMGPGAVQGAMHVAGQAAPQLSQMARYGIGAPGAYLSATHMPKVKNEKGEEVAIPVYDSAARTMIAPPEGYRPGFDAEHMYFAPQDTIGHQVGWQTYKDGRPHITPMSEGMPETGGGSRTGNGLLERLLGRRREEPRRYAKGGEISIWDRIRDGTGAIYHDTADSLDPYGIILPRSKGEAAAQIVNAGRGLYGAVNRTRNDAAEQIVRGVVGAGAPISRTVDQAIVRPTVRAAQQVGDSSVEFYNTVRRGLDAQHETSVGDSEIWRDPAAVPSQYIPAPSYDEKINAMTGLGIALRATPESMYKLNEGVIKNVQEEIEKEALGHMGEQSREAKEKLLDYIARVEAGTVEDHGYDAYNSGETNKRGPVEYKPSEMTLGQILELQSRPTSNPDRMFAVGRYQVIGETLRAAMRGLGLSEDEVYTPELQDRIAEWLIEGGEKRAALTDYVFGKHDDLDAAQYDTAREWAGVVNPRGVGQYDGDKAGNRAHGGMAAVGEVRRLLRDLREENIEGRLAAERYRERARQITGIDRMAAAQRAEAQRLSPTDRNSASRRRMERDGGAPLYAEGGMVQSPPPIFNPNSFAGIFDRPALMPQPMRPVRQPTVAPQPVGPAQPVPNGPTTPMFNFGQDKSIMGTFRDWNQQNPGGQFKDFMLQRNDWMKANRPETARGNLPPNAPWILRRVHEDQQRMMQQGGFPWSRMMRQNQNAHFAHGGYVEGMGDGSSDHVPAMISNTGEPALLSDGEYVVPADVVAHLGNGSNKAGARRLKSLVSAVREEKTGSARMPKRI